MQQQGTLQESNLATLLQTMQSERATGTLSLDSPTGQNASLYFLFGHLFHAVSGNSQGEDVVIGAMAWHDGNYSFDPRAKLPAEETIKSSPSELIAAAERQGLVASGVPAAATASEPAMEAPSWAAPEPAPAETPAENFPSWAEPAPASTELPPWAAQQEQEPEPEPEPEPVAMPAPAPEPEPMPAWQQPSPEPAPAAAPMPAPAPVASAPRAAASGTAGAPFAEPLQIAYPLPSGKVQYEGLKEAFVDFPKLLRTLRSDSQTGYVRLSGGDFQGILLFSQGQLLVSLVSDPALQIGDQAFAAIRRHVDAGAGTLDVIDLSAETVSSLSQLLTAPPVYTGLVGHFVNFPALLEHLQESRTDGAVLAVGSKDIGVILLSKGSVLGAYTKSDPTYRTSTDGVARIAAEKAARIEVKQGTGRTQATDIESALNRLY